MVIVTLRLLIVLQTVPSNSLEVTFTNYINHVVLLMLLSIISPIELSLCGTVSQTVLLLLLLCKFSAVR